MGRRNVAILACAVASLAALAGCSGAAEQPILNQFFMASRLRDNATLGSFSTVAFEPNAQGIVTSFTITSVSPEQRKPLPLKSLAAAEDQAKAADAEYSKRKEDFVAQDEDAVERIAKAGREAKLKGKDAELQASWFKLVDEGVSIARKITDAKRALAAQSAVVDVSVSDPRHPVDVTKYDGDLVSKDVTIDAPVKLPSGQTAQKTLIVTLQRAELKADKPIVGRWVVAGIRDASGSPATPRS
jgi:hypothetical protein